MWVIHESGSCTKGKEKNTTRQSGAGNDKNTEFRAHLMQVLGDTDVFNDKEPIRARRERPCQVLTTMAVDIHLQPAHQHIHVGILLSTTTSYLDDMNTSMNSFTA